MALGPYLLVTGDFARTGAMDRANFALASYLAERGFETHLVTHRADPALAAHPNVSVHRVPRPGGSHLFGAPLLDRAGRRWARRIAARGGKVIVNGGGCIFGGINWVHYVHASYRRESGAGGLRRIKNAVAHLRACAGERRALALAETIIANSMRTADDVIRNFSLPAERVRTIYLGVDPALFRPAGKEERAAMRASLGWDQAAPVAAFIGAMGDRRKGFDTVFEAWRMLAADPRWDAALAVIGAGAELDLHRRRAERAGIAARMRFLGYRRDLAAVLRACDCVAAPTRYDSYGLGVHEALCCGLPAFVTITAGVAERYPETLGGLLLRDPDDASELAERLRAWRACLGAWRKAVEPFGAMLRRYTWDDMAAKITALAEEPA